MDVNDQQNNQIEGDDRQNRAAQRELVRNLQAEADQRLHAHNDLLNQNNILQQALVAQAMRPLPNLPGPKTFKGKREENFRSWLESLELYMTSMRKTLFCE